MKSQVENLNHAGLGWSILVPILVGLPAAALCAALFLRGAGQAEKILREREAARMGLFDPVLRRDLATDNLRALSDGDGLHSQENPNT
jgi:hypothetical protein